MLSYYYYFHILELSFNVTNNCGLPSLSQLEPQFTDLELEHPVDGDITIPGAQDEETDISTLDEPVIDTIVRL